MSQKYTKTFGQVLIVSLTLLFAISGIAAATMPEPPQQQQLPPGVEAGWWQSVQKKIRASEYHFAWQEQAAAYQAPNRAQNLRLAFTEHGLRAMPRSAEATAWEWGLELTGYGDANHVSAVEAPTLQAAGNRLEYQRGNITEWYINDERGLEQGFTLYAPPNAVDSGIAGIPAGLTLELTYTGNVSPRINAEGSEIEFLNAAGAKVLRYHTLYVTDVSGKVLPARFALHKEQSQFAILVDASDAQYPITIDPLLTDADWTAESNQVGAYFGDSVSTAGDVNGDGYSDIIIGAMGYDNSNSTQGRAFLYYGSASGLSTEPDWFAEGEQDQDNGTFGYAVSTAGDVNGDGYSDVIIGAPYFILDEDDEGKAYVYYGSATGLNAQPDWTAVGHCVKCFFGFSVGTAGDVNGDGYSDIIVGEHGFEVDPDNPEDFGKIYVYHGSAIGLHQTADWTDQGEEGAVLGFSVGTAGDVNADGYDDIIVGAVGYEAGRAFAYYGSASGLSAEPNWFAEGEESGNFGTVIVSTAGDVNGDGYSDVIVGEPSYDSTQEYGDEGLVVVYYGSEIGLEDSPAWSKEGEQRYERFGATVSTAGDFNADGYSDVIIGATDYEISYWCESGRVFIYYGSPSGLDSDSSWIVEGDQNYSDFGYAIGQAGDVNGDGFGDIIIGASRYDNPSDDEGKVFMYHGSPAGAQDLPQSDLGRPDRNARTDCDSTRGAMPCWQVNMVNLNLYAKALPLWYDTPVGPSMALMLHYNSQDIHHPFEPLGPKWRLGYNSYLIHSGLTATVTMPDGRRVAYTSAGSGTYRSPTQVFTTLTRVGTNHFELRFQDDTVYVYQKPNPYANVPHLVLVEIRDAHGNSMHLTYNASGQIVEIHDVQDRATRLFYNNGLLSQVLDPFGRTAHFTYNAVTHNLIRITDMGGYAVDLEYQQYTYPSDPDEPTFTEYFLSSIENPRGRWEFTIEPADGEEIGSVTYPAPGAYMGENYRITIINPEQGKEEYYYNSASHQNWYVSPRDYVAYGGPQANNAAESVPKVTYHLQAFEDRTSEITRANFPEGGFIGYGYDAQRNRLSVEDTLGQTSYTYNDFGHPTSVTNPRQVTTILGYKPNGIDLETIEFDPETVEFDLGTIRLDYNEKHQVASFTDRMSETTTFHYNDAGQITVKIDPVGMTNYFYNASTHQLLQIIRDAEEVAEFTYDNVGRVRTATDATGLTLTYSYNNLNQVTEIAYPDGKSVRYTYADDVPVLESSTDRAGQTTTFVYDDLLRLTEVTYPDTGTVTYTYDANSNLEELTDAEQHTTRFGYDFDNRLISKTYHDDKTMSWSYNDADLVNQVTNGRGVTTSFTYDANGNVELIDYADDTPDVAYTYDDYDRFITRADGIGAWEFTYDANSRLERVTGPWVNHRLTYEYDALGRRKKVTPALGSSISYVYDSLNRLQRVTSSYGGYHYEYPLNASPLVERLTRSDDSWTKYEYDELNRLTDILNSTSNGEVITRHTFTYGDNDLREQETSVNDLALPVSASEDLTYGYNAVNQMISDSNSHTYTYDDDGNLTGGFTPEGFPFTAAYDAANRLISLQYTDGGGGSHTYAYAYSGDGFLAQINDLRIVRDGALALQERNPAGDILREYTWGLSLGGGIGGLLSLHVPQGDAHYNYLYDGKGNVEAILDNTQTIVAQYLYDPFGNLLAQSGTLEQPFRFSTKRCDAETGLVYYGRRFYSPAMSRWITRDPLGEQGGLNLYAFVGNNPVNWTDPWGLQMGYLGQVFRTPTHSRCPSRMGAVTGDGFGVTFGVGIAKFFSVAGGASFLQVCDGYGNKAVAICGGLGAATGSGILAGLQSTEWNGVGTIFDIEGASLGVSTGGGGAIGIGVAAEMSPLDGSGTVIIGAGAGGFAGTTGLGSGCKLFIKRDKDGLQIYSPSEREKLQRDFEKWLLWWQQGRGVHK